MIDRVLAENTAGRQPGVPGADDDRCDVFDVGPVASVAARYTTSTVTLVGLVTMSYTAERFCDCATSASMSFFEASASMWKVTLMSS